MAFVTPLMTLKVWNLLSDPYDHEQLASNFIKIDKHDHGANGGTQIQTAGIADGAVTAAKIDPGALIVPDNSVTTPKLVDDAVTQAKMADNSVGAPQILAGAVGNSELAADAVTETRIANNAVSGEKIDPDVLDVRRVIAEAGIVWGPALGGNQNFLAGELVGAVADNTATTDLISVFRFDDSDYAILNKTTYIAVELICATNATAPAVTIDTDVQRYTSTGGANVLQFALVGGSAITNVAQITNPTASSITIATSTKIAGPGTLNDLVIRWFITGAGAANSLINLRTRVLLWHE